MIVIGLFGLQPVEHTFRYIADHGLKQVNLAGTFNNWDKNGDPMRTDDGRDWSVTVKLVPGKYQYKFVLDGSTWTPDPKGVTIDDGNGNRNSVIVIYPNDFDSPARLGDGRITSSVLGHATAVPDFNYDRGRLTITMTARPGDVKNITLESGAGSFPMKLIGQNEVVARYRAQMPWNRKSDLAYDFKLDDGAKVAYFGPKGLTAYATGNRYIVSAAKFKPFVVPDWVEKTVIYQIFPDRFANGDHSNDPKDVVPWNAKPTYTNKFGGDVAGIEQHLDYLKTLGIGAIYFNPVFWSPSNHRYQAIDYYKIDPEFGTNAQFVKLTHELKQDGVRTVLDGVFNHTSTQFFAFADVLRNGAASKYKDWYTFHSFPVQMQPQPNYECWFGSPSMPKLHILNPATEAYFLKIPQYWQTHADIAGWRLDVANEVPMDYWRAFRKTVKKINPNAWIVGEEWGDASPWLGGDQWDATMNYRFRDAVLQLVAKGTSNKPSECLGRLMDAYASYAPQVSRNMMNLIDSHDTPRILSECGGDTDLEHLAAIIQFTWVGAPCVYYGDELGMQGGADPDNRRGMVWALDNSSNATLRLYQRLIALRKSSPILQSGDPIAIGADDRSGTMVYGRTLEGQTAYVAINRSNESRSVSIRTTAHTGFRDALSGARISATNGVLHLSLAPKRAAIVMPVLGTVPHLRLSRRQSLSRKGPRLQSNVHRST